LLSPADTETTGAGGNARPSATAGTSSSPRFERAESFFASLPQWAMLFALGWLILFGLRQASPRTWQSQLFTPPR